MHFWFYRFLFLKLIINWMRMKIIIFDWLILIKHHITMMKVCTKIGNSLTHIQKQNFSNMLFNSSANPIKERVMSTPTWPVPYYQRMLKAYPVRCKFIWKYKEQKTVNLSLMDFDADDTNWYAAKEILNETLKGRQIV